MHTMKKKREKDRLRADSYKIAVIGGDKRQVYLARILAEKGYEVAVYGLCERVHDERIREATSLKEALKEVDAAVGPVPFIRSGKITGTYEVPDMNVEMLFDELPDNAVFFAGNIPGEVRRYAEGKGLRACDMMIDELVAARNADCCCQKYSGKESPRRILEHLRAPASHDFPYRRLLCMLAGIVGTHRYHRHH